MSERANSANAESAEHAYTPGTFEIRLAYAYFNDDSDEDWETSRARSYAAFDRWLDAIQDRAYLTGVGDGIDAEKRSSEDVGVSPALGGFC